MENNLKSYTKIGGIFGILSITFGLIGDIIALILFPGYNFLRNSVSYLCIGPGGLFFQFGTALSGIFALIFVLCVIQTLDEESTNPIIKKWAISFAIISCVSFMNLGIFCGSYPIIDLIHGVSAVISWLSGIGYITLFSILMLKELKYPKIIAYVGFIVSSSLSFMIVLFILYYSPGIKEVVMILPLVEWINTFALIFWYFMVSTYLLAK
ncbi:MAG TPA: DUF998 domain-containing protein [archaeon]|nr:DUF998 domain-containing protein [archaeon]